MNGAKTKEKLRSSAENQVMFNEAIRKVIEEKDKKIDILENSLKSSQAERTDTNNQTLIRYVIIWKLHIFLIEPFPSSTTLK